MCLDEFSVVYGHIELVMTLSTIGFLVDISNYSPVVSCCGFSSTEGCQMWSFFVFGRCLPRRGT